MNWEDLRHFVVLARAGSLSEAARVLAVDHTTVARRVSALEGALGIRLVDRLPRSYALTEDGRRIAALGERLEHEAFAVLRAAQAAAPALAGTVRVSAPPALASMVVTPALARLRQVHPGILVELIGEARAADLDKREADIALRLAAPKGESLVVRKLGELTFGLYAQPSYAATRRPEDYEFVAYDDSLDHVAEQGWLRAMAPEWRVVFRANDLHSLVAATRAGLGVAALPRFVARGDSGLESLQPWSPAPPPTRPLWLVVHDDLRRSPRVRAVMDFLAEAVREALP